MNRARDWLEQARWNLRHAEGSLGLGDYAWACFAVRLAGEVLAFAAALVERHDPDLPL